MMTLSWPSISVLSLPQEDIQFTLKDNLQELQ